MNYVLRKKKIAIEMKDIILIIEISFNNFFHHDA